MEPPTADQRPAPAEREELLLIVADCYAALYEGDPAERDAALLRCRDALGRDGYWDRPQPAFFEGH